MSTLIIKMGDLFFWATSAEYRRESRMIQDKSKWTREDVIEMERRAEELIKEMERKKMATNTQ